MLFLLLSVSFHANSQDIKLPYALRKAMDQVDTNTIRANIAYLADDKLKGRLPGTEGYQMAVDYVVEQYKKIGLIPAGDHNSYLQKIILRKATLDNASLALVLKDNNGNTDTISSRRDFTVIPHPLKPSSAIETGIVFAGYGVEIPGQYSDYTGIDVNGKVVVVLRGAPPGLHSTLAAHFNNAGNKMTLAYRKGAAGIIIADTTAAVSSANTRTPTLTIALNPDKTQAYGRGSTGLLDLAVNASFSALQYLFMHSGKNLDEVIAELKKGKPQSFPIPLRLSASYKSDFHDFESYNVVGKIQGSDPALKNEYVVHTAHLDHLGIGKPVNGDSIYNGAHDNASGVASLIEIARIYKTSAVKIKRSVLIVMVTGEEMGLIGSSYFAANPTVPKSSIVADVNTDMPTVITPLLSVVPLGAEHSSLVNNVRFAANYLKLDIENDPEPSENRFVRSDQYSFVMNGIPALHIKYGNKTNIPGFNPVAYVKTWRAKYYHQSADGMDGLFNFTAAKTYVQLNFLISYSIAQSKEKPTWNKGDLFGL